MTLKIESMRLFREDSSEMSSSEAEFRLVILSFKFSFLPVCPESEISKKELNSSLRLEKAGEPRILIERRGCTLAPGS